MLELNLPFQNKIQNSSEAQKTIEGWKSKNESIVFTNGVFDLLHPGHIDYLYNTSALADKMVLGLNSDNSVRTLNKGAARPIKTEEMRSIILAAMEFIDLIVIFDDSTPLSLIKEIKPTVLAKGGDYDATCTDENSKKYIVGSKEVASWGGKTVTLDFVPGYSTTNLEQKIILANQS